TLLKPVRDTIRPFGCAIEGLVGNDAAREVRRFSADWGEVGMDLQIEHAPLCDLGVVHLDLVGLRERRCGCGKQYQGCNRALQWTHSSRIPQGCVRNSARVRVALA